MSYGIDTCPYRVRVFHLVKAVSCEFENIPTLFVHNGPPEILIIFLHMSTVSKMQNFTLISNPLKQLETNARGENYWPTT
jgi:hypothetical protein